MSSGRERGHRSRPKRTWLNNLYQFWNGPGSAKERYAYDYATALPMRIVAALDYRGVGVQACLWTGTLPRQSRIRRLVEASELQSSDASSFVVGTVLAIDGGYLA
jgi:hypothetical protein